MKSLTFNKNSLHYKLARLGGVSQWDDTDICAYTRNVLMGILWSVVIVGLFTFASACLIDLLFGIVFSIIYQTMLFTPMAYATMMFIGVLSVKGFICFCQYQHGKWKMEKRNAPQTPKVPDGFLKAAYKSHKEKYCVRVDFK